MRSPHALSLALLVACKSPYRDLGDDPLDQARLADGEPLAHLADALGDDDAVVTDLFDDDELAFASAPDPSALFAARHARHAALAPLDGATVDLRVLTYNVGLLDRGYLGGHVAVPHIEERREAMAEQLLDGRWDVLFLQEVWEWDDVELLGAAGEDAGYAWYAGSERTHRETGVVILVRAELVGGAEEQEEGQYAAQRKLENWPGPNLKRGWIRWSFDLAGTTRRLQLWDTHLTPFANRWETRDLQARELGLAVRDRDEGAIVLVGGDLNAGTFYAEDVWVDGEGEESSQWWNNATMWALLQHYGDLDDLVNAASEHQDVDLGLQVPIGGGSAALERPYASDTFCELPDVAFTATDCNSLSFASYAGQEFPARLDHLLFADPDGALRATATSLEYVEPLDLGVETELSDHYGVSVDVSIAP